MKWCYQYTGKATSSYTIWVEGLCCICLNSSFTGVQKVQYIDVYFVTLIFNCPPSSKFTLMNKSKVPFFLLDAQLENIRKIS